MARPETQSAKQDQFNLRFPDGMRDLIRREAERNGRSMNAEIILRLEDTLPKVQTLIDLGQNANQASMEEHVYRRRAELLAKAEQQASDLHESLAALRELNEEEVSLLRYRKLKDSP